MKVLLSWLQEFAPIKGDPEELAVQLTDLGMVVEEFGVVGASLDGVIVAKVLELGSHPQADRIQLVQVDTGDGVPLQICCGAFNMAVGDLVPLATIGTVMSNGMEIAQRKLRGELSNGMICSASELELPEPKGVDDGIMVLDSSLTVGQPLAEALDQRSDIVFDLDIEGNRPDALSIVGVARDLAARLGEEFTLPKPDVPVTEVAAADVSSVQIIDGQLCPRFGVRVLNDVTVGESPAWMQQRLTAAGMRPINAIVDISNYVMIELGQPNHTYDLDLVPDGALVIRQASDGEELTTLDGTSRALKPGEGVIANAKDEAIGLAGVMGGASTEISDGTTNVLLEAAVWDRMSVAHTARRLNLRSEASTRFERGVDPFGIELALDRFVQLAIEICGASVASGVLIEEGSVSSAPQVDVRVQRVNDLLNLSLTSDKIVSLLEPIGFKAVDRDESTLTVQIPTWRPDSSIEEDVIEEIARHHGYEKSGKRVPTPTQAGELSPEQRERRTLRQAFLANGFSEAMPLPFLAPGDLEKVGLPAEGIPISYPLVAEESILRTSLMPGLLKAVGYNQTHRSGPVKLYELGSVFHAADDVEASPLPSEPEWVAAAWSGFTPEDKAAEQAVRLLYSVAESLGLAGVTVRNAAVEGLHPKRSAEVVFRGRVVGVVGEVDPGVSESFAVEGRVAWLALESAPIIAAAGGVKKYRPVSRFPSSDIDLAFVTPLDVSAVELARTLKKAGEGLVQSVELFDVFRSDELGSEHRSLAYNVRLQSSEKTLTDAEVATVRDACISAVSERHKAVLR